MRWDVVEEDSLPRSTYCVIVRGSRWHIAYRPVSMPIHVTSRRYWSRLECLVLRDARAKEAVTSLPIRVMTVMIYGVIAHGTACGPSFLAAECIDAHAGGFRISSTALNIASAMLWSVCLAG